MGYYANGDTRKMIQTSEDDEEYENELSNATPTGLLNQTNVRNKQYFTSEISQKISPARKPSIADDTDQPFWAEDELSNSESRYQLNTKQRRRYSLSYRNRITERYAKRLSNIERYPPCSKVKKKCSRKKGTSLISKDKSTYVGCKNFNQKQMQKHHPFVMNRKS